MNRLTLKETMDRLLLLIRSGYPVIYIVSHEESRVLNFLAKIARVIKAENPQKNFLQWYQGLGLEELDPSSLSVVNVNLSKPEEINWLDIKIIPNNCERNSKGNQNPLEALNSIKNANEINQRFLRDSITVFFDLHPYLRQDSLNSSMGSLVRPLRNSADALRRYYDEKRNSEEQFYKTIIVVAPSAAELSLELKHDIIEIDFPLPEIDELRLTLINMLPPDDARDLGDNLDSGILKFPEHITEQSEKAGLCDEISGAGRGLCLEDYKRGLNMFAVRGEHLSEERIEDMLDLKAKVITDKALQYTPHVKIELGGLSAIKEWISIRKDPVTRESVRKQYRLPPPKGVMLCGVSGGGKSQLAKLIAKEFNLALLRLDVGALFGRYVGESEESTRRALQLAEVLAPVVLWIDEADKAFSGVGAGGDSGVSARVFGHFLTWLSEKQDSVFVVVTANDFRKMLDDFPEFGRKGRFDEIFWVDLPDENARKEIFQIYLSPHFKDGYLELDETELLNIAAKNNIGGLKGKTLLEKFCCLLGHGNISFNMTGAEIEHAINNALYRAYRSTTQKFTTDLIVETVKGLMPRALYEDTSKDYRNLQVLSGEAENKHWIFVGKKREPDENK
jgi:hypothetical protein